MTQLQSAIGHTYDITVDSDATTGVGRASFFDGGGGITIDTFGTLGTGGTFGGCFGCFGTMACCC